MFMKYFFIYLLIINLIGFFSMFLDKQKAKRGKWRIPEKTLFLFALIGGSLGCILGMNTFRHKTQHWYFKFGMPAIFIAETALVLFVYFKFIA